ncbi:FAD-dependent monooxygenase [Williamwhitmania taraxaci]|uniref:2-polyprenyl-6-methoxyphenol hydroxylase n=1 Tax=Williamwhitmania taraxaci TaxID=1640674 RepID=A0A1G6SSL1_9BACT|nr:FAD-dependent monooxygenase [Williamwhitmania taraxaci]SDD19920.1 2-polyprenyl-6-methoxyphenol hydroxylase [Williamwhitmania taraxaci]
MESDEKITVDVLIAGAGPAGLMMACQLALQNISFRIIDKKTSPAIYSGALIVHARTLEIFHQMGIAEKAMKAGTTAKTINIQFNHLRDTTVVDISEFGKGLTLFPHLLMLEQWQTETLLIEFLNEHGHSVENNTTLLTFTQDNEGITSEIQKSNGTTEIIKSRFLIGADGNNSLVRTRLKIPFPGKTHKARLFITDCEAKLSLAANQIFFSFANDYTAGFFPLPDNRWRIDGLIPAIQKEEKVEFDDVKNFFGNPIHFGIELHHPQWFSIFRSHSRCAKSFRQNRCLLVGDAAHVHSPVGAQGMNTGLQDAHNLAWKLAFYIHEKALEDLLDTYQKERRPLALNIIRHTDLAYSFMANNFFFVRFFRLKLAPLLLPMVITWFKKNIALRTKIFISLSGIGIKYKNSILTDSLSSVSFPAHSPKPGDRLPYLTYEMAGRSCALNDGLDSRTFHLLIFGKQELPSPFQAVVDLYTDVISIKYIAYESSTHTLFKSLGLENEGCYFVRPDLYIAWRSREFDFVSLSNYLRKFLK